MGFGEEPRTQMVVRNSIRRQSLHTSLLCYRFAFALAIAFAIALAFALAIAFAYTMDHSTPLRIVQQVPGLMRSLNNDWYATVIHRHQNSAQIGDHYLVDQQIDQIRNVLVCSQYLVAFLDEGWVRYMVSFEYGQPSPVPHTHDARISVYNYHHVQNAYAANPVVGSSAWFMASAAAAPLPALP